MIITMRIDFRLLKYFGISLSSKKRYFIYYDPHTWSIMDIWDDFETALKEGYNTTLGEYRKQVHCKVIYTHHDNSTGIAQFKNADEHFVGHNHVFYKGFMQNLDMWQLLNDLTYCIQENEEDTYYIGYHINGNMKPYSDHVNRILYDMDGKRNPDI